MAIVMEGKVALVRNGTVIAERGPGEVIGEMALLSGMPRGRPATTAGARRTRDLYRPEALGGSLAEPPVCCLTPPLSESPHEETR